MIRAKLLCDFDHRAQRPRSESFLSKSAGDAQAAKDLGNDANEA